MIMNIEMKNILCAVDFSRFTPQLVHYGAALATQFQARLLMFHSVGHFGNDLYASIAVEQGMGLQEMAERARQKILRMMQPYDVDWKLVVTHGDPVDRAARVANNRGVDLVLAASHGISGLKRLLIGTVVERMARRLSCPFLVVRTGRHGHKSNFRKAFPIKNIVVGCDLHSEVSPYLDYACFLAESFQAEIHLMHTLESPVNEDIGDKIEGSYDKVQQNLRQKIYDRLLHIYTDRYKGNAGANIVVETGVPEEALTRYAKQKSADLIVVGVRRHGTLEKILVGSTTESVLRHSPCPVLVVSPKSVS